MTRLSVLSNQPVTDVVDLRSTHEAADTLLILYGSEIHKDGTNIHIYASDTDVFIFALVTMAQLGDEATVIMGTGVNRRRVRLQPIYHDLGQCRVSALKGFHALSGCDQLGVYLARARMLGGIYLRKPANRSSLPWQLGIGDEPNAQVICQLFSIKNQTFTKSLEL